MADFLGNSSDSTDFGLKELLWDSEEDGFWDYFSKFDAEVQAKRTRNPLTFPIPPSVQPHCTSMSTTSSATTSAPCPTTSNPDHHYHILSEIQNTPTGTCRKPFNDEDLDRFVEQQNTNHKTESDIRKWYQWCEEHGESRQLKDIPQAELYRLLAHFFVTARRKDSTLYEPDTLTSFQRSLDRHLTRDLRQPYSILRDQKFTVSHEALKAAQKHLKTEGKGNKPNAADALEPADIERM